MLEEEEEVLNDTCCVCGEAVHNPLIDENGDLNANGQTCPVPFPEISLCDYCYDKGFLICSQCGSAGLGYKIDDIFNFCSKKCEKAFKKECKRHQH